ncbi:low molecular weight protein-tyrosine-phosphatase [Jonesia quinghaiensis]|uniref:low molecular weight protein-tyrosine-phosphatase n=1 Tax=Jonesia quinghaiensis TaxID=262806 RepID=UPI00048DE49C|nr:low molecular weight protein-tyrosine-phosphatase [Jonesia quinghaiensis]
MYAIMMVCTGNICRSPMAQYVLDDKLRQHGLADVVRVASSGVSDEEAGNPIDHRARRALLDAGYTDATIAAHRARQIEASDIGSHDLILAMTTSHARAIRRLADQAGTPEATDHIVMFRSFDPQAPGAATFHDEYLLDVEDPWYGGMKDFQICLEQVEAATDGIIEFLKMELNKG